MTPTPSALTELADRCDEDHMVKISALITRLQSTMEQFGDTCVYIRRGGLSWGAVALNRRDDDQKHGVFDIHAQHDRDLLQRAEQVERLIASRRVAEMRLNEAVTALREIAAMDPKGFRADDLGRASLRARAALQASSEETS